MSIRSFYKIFGIVIGINTINQYSEALLQIYIASTMAAFFNDALKGQFNSILVSLPRFAIIFTGVVLVQTTITVITELFRQKNKEAIKFMIYDQFLNNELNRIEKKGSGEILDRFTRDVEQIVAGYDTAVTIILASSLAALTYISFLLKINIGITFCLLALGLLPVIPPYILKTSYAAGYKEMSRVKEKVNSFLKESIEGFDFIKLNNLYSIMENKYVSHQEALTRVLVNLHKVLCIDQGINTGISNVSKFSSYGIIGYCVLRGYISLGESVELLLVSMGLFTSLKNIFEKYTAILGGKISLQRLNEILAKEVGPTGSLIINSVNRIAACDLSFSYEGKIEVLTNFNLEFSRGDKILIKGANGAGKSTFIKLLLGLYKSCKGDIYINQIPIKDIDIDSYRRHVTWVPQKQCFFGENALKNLELYKDRDDERLKSYLRRFNLKVEGLESKLTDNLSGGERQKLMLIRAFIRSGEILILDEPTNYLDTEAKEQFKKIIEETDKTIIIISHDEDIYDMFRNKYRIKGGKIYRDFSFL